jgi:arabinan endo-1,5-alpha-L-arabinosidase
MKAYDIHIRDPFVFPDPKSRKYYLFGTTDEDCWDADGIGFDYYESDDRVDWRGPFPAFRPAAGFWATKNFWAPEVHYYHEKYYMLATFKRPGRYRGTQVLSSEAVYGPYECLSDGPVTPDNWECLDGTLFIDDHDDPWMVFCLEWVQVSNGAMFAMRLSRDLRTSVGRPVFLFNASEAAWVNHPDWPPGDPKRSFPTYVTDGPFIIRNFNGKLLMLWSSLGESGYAMGLAVSDSGQITGPWRQIDAPVWGKDGGHGMVFKSFEGKTFLTFHMPNQRGLERLRFYEVTQLSDSLMITNDA